MNTVFFKQKMFFIPNEILSKKAVRVFSCSASEVTVDYAENNLYISVYT